MLKYAPLALLMALSCGPAMAQGPAAAAPAAPAIGPAPNPDHPIGGYLLAPAASTRLVEKVFQDASGLPLYVLDRECRGQCAVLFPPLTPAEGAQPPSGDWTIRVRDENAHRQWVYKGKPVYTFLQDKTDQHPMAENVIPGVALARP